MSEISGLEEYIESIRKKRRRLQDMKNVFLNSAQTEPDQFKRVTSKAFARHAEIMEDLFMNIEMLVIMNSGLINQNETLRDIVIQLQEVKGNQRMRLNIDNAFREYNEKVKNNLMNLLKVRQISYR